MNTKSLTALALAGLFGYWLYNRQQASTAVDTLPDSSDIPDDVTNSSPPLIDSAVNAVQSAVSGQPLGVRINNPGDLREAGIAWIGKSADQSAGNGYTVFDTAPDGIRALIVNLRNQWNFHQLDTVASVVAKFAPPSDKNPTGAYITNVAAYLGVSPTDAIDMTDANTLRLFAKAVIIQEVGSQWLQYYIDNGAFEQGAQLAGV